MRNGKKEGRMNYTETKQIRLTREMAESIEAKALERHCTDSDIVRQAVCNYINRAASDTEVVHASLSENSRKIRYLENKVELLALVVFEQTKFLMRTLPIRQTNTDSAVGAEFEKFMRRCSKALKANHAGVLEAMALDAYERSGEDENGGA